MMNINTINLTTTHPAFPYLKSLLFNLIISILIASLFTNSNAQSFEAAAISIASRKRCNFKLSSESGLCHKCAGIRKQPIACVHQGCKYCSWESSRDQPVCKSTSIRKYCPIAFQTNDLSNLPKSPSLSAPTPIV